MARGPAWLRGQHGACPSAESTHSHCEGTGRPLCALSAVLEQSGALRSCGWRRWQELVPFHTASFIPHQHPVRARLSSSPFSGEGIVPGHLLGICTPIFCLLDQGPFGCLENVKSKGQDHGQRLGVGRAERGLSHLSPPPGPSVPSTGCGIENNP